MIKIWYIKRSLQVNMCIPTGGQASRSKISIGFGPSFAICVFSAILTFQSNARAVFARVSRFFTIRSSLLLKVCSSPSSVLNFFERSSSSCCRRSSLLLKVCSSPSSVLKAGLFLSARVRLVVDGRCYC
jgi:hypothetical protein